MVRGFPAVPGWGDRGGSTVAGAAVVRAARRPEPPSPATTATVPRCRCRPGPDDSNGPTPSFSVAEVYLPTNGGDIVVFTSTAEILDDRRAVR